MQQKYVQLFGMFYLCYWQHLVSVYGQSDGDLRLSLGYEGILEIYYNGTWGYVCDDGWDDKDSWVACRSLGFGNVKTIQIQYYHPNRTEEFKISDVNCTGNENSLLGCHYSNTVTNCDYYEHIYLDCNLDHCQSYLHNAEYSAQLVRYFNGEDWFYICKDNFSEKNSHVICYENYGTKALNYTFLSSSSLTANYSFYPYQFNCKGEEASLCNCPTVNQTCESSELVAVLCKKEVVNEGAIRLTNDDERFLQAYINSEWIFICAYSYYSFSDDQDLNYYLSYTMDIACRELGYSKVKSFQLENDYYYLYYSQQNFLQLGFCPRNVTKLSDCNNNYYYYYCHSKISLRCEAETCATSLQFNSTSNSYQLVQTYVDNSWFYICPDSFTKSDADVICRNSELTSSISFGHVSLENQVHPISPNSYACTGNESFLCSCPSDTSTCNSSTAVNVLCYEPNNGSIRLSNGFNGYAEVYNGDWKLVCDYQFNSIEADIICRSAGFRRAESFSYLYNYYNYFYSQPDVNTINDVHCFGNETSLLDCSYSEYSECYQENIVTCEEDGCESFLRNPESLEAVQIYIDQWYSLCEDNFTQQTADIICRENHDSNASSYTFLPIQPSNYPIYPFYLQCDGNENSICACEMISQQCSSNRIVHVECRKQSNGHLRLSNGTSGILEVYLDGWKRVCNNNYRSLSQAVANVACRYLGYRDATAFSSIYTSYITTNIFPNPRCFGNETNILDCVYDLASTCHYESYISCRTEGCQSYTFGENASEHPVGMYMNENWYYLCSNSLSTKEADVICRENGFLNGVDSISSIHKSQLEISYEIYPYNITCNGNESSLCDCSVMEMQSTEGNIAAIRCSQPDQGTLRYSNQYPNMLEIYNNGGWSHICRFNWGNSDSNVACRQLGYRRYSRYSYTSTTQIATSSYPNNFGNVSCDGTESSLVDCSYSNASCQSFVSYYTNYKVLLYCTSGDCEVFAPYATQSYQIVEYFINQQRYHICADGFTAENANVVCRETVNTRSIHHRAVSELNLPPNTQIYPLQHSCLGNESSLCNCSTFQQLCPSGSSVEVQCGTPDQETLRYSDLYSNVLEIYYNGGWSYICPYSWSVTDSNVACRQLGFTSSHYHFYYYRTLIATSFLNNFQVSCNGNESNIIDCSYTNDTCYSYSSSNYYYTYYLGLYCTGGDCEVHAPFATDRFQIVEYFVNQKRYYLCADGFTAENADVVCRETSNTLSIAVRSVSLTDLPLNTQIYPLQHFCFGNESSICNCTTSQQSCPNGSVVEVQCGTPVNGSIRITSIGKYLEIYLDGWKYVCGGYFQHKDAIVACRHQGFSNVRNWNYAYSNDNSYWRRNIDCIGNETNLLDCPYTTSSYCYSRVKLYCETENCESILINGDENLTPVRYYDGHSNYYLCKQGFTIETADVVCREGGYGGVFSIEGTQSSNTGVHYAISNRAYTCNGKEHSLCNCSYTVQTCDDGIISEIRCKNAEQGQIRLISQNRLLFYYNQWRYICSQRWDIGDSDVACRQLGYRNSVSSTLIYNYYYYYSYYYSNLENFVTDVTCFGNETQLSECRYHLASYCDSYYTVSLTCQPGGCESYAPNAASYPQSVRYYSGGWYHLCGDGFTQENADVVCRENEGTTVLSYSNFANSNLTSGLQILKRRFTCTGRETSLCDCSSSIESCPSNTVVKLQCNTPAYGHIRLTNKDSGVLEIYLNQWGYVCDDGWNRIASAVVCRQLGLGRLISFETGVEVNDLLYPFLIDDVDCNGNESTIYECTHTLRHNCGSGEHVSITCGSNQTITTPTTSTTTVPTTSTTAIPTTSTTAIPTATTIVSASTPITTTSSIVSTTPVFSGITPKITFPSMNITETLNRTDTVIQSFECTATGDPTPDIYWTRDFKTRFIDSPILQINITDLSTDGEKVFYCVAKNLAGRDMVSVTFKIVLTTEDIANTLKVIMDDLDEVETISDDKSGQTADITKVVIDASNENVDINGEERSKILENAATTTKLIVEKTNGTFSNETTEKIAGLLSSIINGSSDIQESESTISQQGEESTVATIPSALAITLNTLERFSQRLSEELANSGVYSVKTVVSRLITIVVQNVELERSEDGETKADIELPVKNSDDVEYSVMITLSTNLAFILSTNGKSLSIATSIVKRIEVQESDSSQPTQGSDILTIALAGRSGIVELTENVTFSFDVYSNKPSESTCVFLNGTRWVNDGLSTHQKTTNLTNCVSSHFTSFAVFVTPYKNSKSYTESIVLSAISYLFVGTSFIFLLISLILFLMTGKAFFKVEANIIYFNYCLSMLLATGLFVFGIQVGTYNIVLCKIIAFLLHYIWLSVFTWTLCIGILIMHKIVINVMSTKKIYKYLIIFGWVFPLLIPFITITAAQDQYVDASSHCFLNVTRGVIWAFICPILVIISINVVFLVIALIRIMQIKSTDQNNETMKIAKDALITGLVLTPVLGLPWLILIFNVTIQHSVLEWLFIIINGAMGLVFFLVVVLRNKEVLTRFKRKKETTVSNAQQSTRQNVPSSSARSTFTSNRFRKTNTLERHLVKESEIQNASIEPSELYTSPYNTMDNQNAIYELYPGDKKDFEGTPGIADGKMTGYDNPVYTNDTLENPPVYSNLSKLEMMTEVHSNPMYLQPPSAGYTNELYSNIADVTESDTQAFFDPDEAET